MQITDATEICAIIPTFRPDDGLQQRIDRLAIQVGHIVLVDDSGDPATASTLETLAHRYSNLSLLRNQCNLGLAASLNRGIAEANRRGFGWILTLDDDTTVERDMCGQLVEGWSEISKAGPIGILAMSWGAGHQGQSVDRIEYKSKRMVITSGSLMAMAIFDHVGPFREEFIIDSVDTDYCLRVRARGLPVLQLARRGFTQRLGEPRTVKWGPFRRTILEHSALRTYYRVRNSTTLLMEYWWREPMYAMGCVYCDLQQLLATLFFYRQKDRHLAAMVTGVKHACMGLFGHYAAN